MSQHHYPKVVYKDGKLGGAWATVHSEGEERQANEIGLHDNRTGPLAKKESAEPIANTAILTEKKQGRPRKAA